MKPMNAIAAWDSRELAEVARIETGGTPPTSDRSLYGNDVPFASPADIGAQRWITTTDKNLSLAGWNRARRLPAGSILVVCIGSTIGKVGMAAIPMATNQQINAVIPSEKIDRDFLYYFLCLSANEIRGQASEQAVPIINKSTFGRLIVAMPPLPEQQAIAAALSDADGVVAGLERVIAKKRLIKQGAMQDLLTARRRLPGFSGEWEVKRLGSLGVCLRGVSYDGSADLFETKTPHSIMLLRANNVQNGEIVYSDVQHVRKERVKPVQCLKRGDVLVCMANGSRALVGKAGVFWDGDGSAYTFGAFMGCFRPAAGAAADGYVPFLFQSDEYRNQLSVILSGSAINNLAPSQILGFSFKLPVDYSEQQAIAAVLSDMDAEIQTLESRLAKARAVKEGMMQNLLTGRVRLV